MTDEPSGWIGWFPGGENPHLSPEVVARLEEEMREQSEQRGRHQARVVVDVFENGEAVPQVQFPRDSDIGPMDRVRTADVVRVAAAALAVWR